MIKIALLGHDLHNDNLGVGALTVSQIHLIRNVASRLDLKVRISVLNSGGARPACANGPDVVDKISRPLRRPFELFRTLNENDIVVDISGGDSFSDIYPTRRMSIIFLQKFVAHILGKPVIVAPQTIGPFTSGIWRRLAAITLRRSAIVATRDAQSTAFIRELGIERDIIEASDVALKLPYSHAPRPVSIPVRVGLNISGLLMQGGYDGRAFGLTADYPALMRATIRHFVEHPSNCEVHLVPHVISWNESGAEDDQTASLKLSKEFPEAIIAPRFETPSEAKTYIAGLDFFVGARMHACIAAFSTNVPVVPLAYSRKFSGLFGSLGYDYTIDCTTEENEQILTRILDYFEDRAEMARLAKVAVEGGLQRLELFEEALGVELLRQAR